MNKKINFLIVLILLLVLAPVVLADEGEALAVPVTYEDVVQTGVPIVSLLLAIVALVRSGKYAQVDQRATGWFQEKQSDRDYMDRMERLYAQSHERDKWFFDHFATTLKAVSPYTPFNFDDAASKFLQDMKEPGPAVTAAAPEKLE